MFFKMGAVFTHMYGECRLVQLPDRDAQARAIAVQVIDSFLGV